MAKYGQIWPFWPSGRPWEALGGPGQPWPAAHQLDVQNRASGGPWEALGGPGRPFWPFWPPGRPWEALGGPGRPPGANIHQFQSKYRPFWPPGRPWEAILAPGRPKWPYLAPWEALGGPGRPWEALYRGFKGVLRVPGALGGPGRPWEAILRPKRGSQLGNPLFWPLPGHGGETWAFWPPGGQNGSKKGSKRGQKWPFWPHFGLILDPLWDPLWPGLATFPHAQRGFLASWQP